VGAFAGFVIAIVDGVNDNTFFGGAFATAAVVDLSLAEGFVAGNYDDTQIVGKR
jgi:hypothetical protein